MSSIKNDGKKDLIEVELEKFISREGEDQEC